jgi:hypothetical protein
MSGRVGLDDLKAKFAVKKADKWDGNDAKPIQEVSHLTRVINQTYHNI